MTTNAADSTPVAPPRTLSRWLALPIAIIFTSLFGVMSGVGMFTFGYGKGWSYLSNKPTTCANCHVMQGHYDSWQNSTHRHVAVCNDCHLPHNHLRTLLTEADNGFNHSLAFTLENFHEPIQIKPRNRRVTQGACISCHADTVHQMLPEDPEGRCFLVSIVIVLWATPYGKVPVTY